ncbi:uncharacterized protein [Palaemon carinicauda]|uniref:uncharacterized protein n=1 Tax=Palaemon carinicauda TaxID=392227 RepID=UPI0035B5A605
MEAYPHFLMLYPEVFHPKLCLTPPVPAKHGIYCHIKTTGPPMFTRYSCQAPDRLAAPKHTFVKMEEMGLCQNDSSPWLSLLHIVLKKDGSLCPCGDCRHLNIQTEPYHYPFSNIADVISYLLKGKFFSSLDLLETSPRL